MRCIVDGYSGSGARSGRAGTQRTLAEVHSERVSWLTVFHRSVHQHVLGLDSRSAVLRMRASVLGWVGGQRRHSHMHGGKEM